MPGQFTNPINKFLKQKRLNANSEPALVSFQHSLRMLYALFYIIVFVLIGCFYYFFLTKKFDNFALRQVMNLAIAKKHPANHLFGLVNLLVAGFFQFILFIAMCIIFPIRWKNIVYDNFRIIQLLYGVLLGLADLVVCNIVGSLVLKGLNVAGSKALKVKIEKMSNQGISGWVNSFKLAFENFSFLTVFPTALFYIIIEELIFRGTILFSFYQIPGLSYSMMIILPTILFILAQRPGIPSTINAIYPMSSAFAIGIIHNWLMLKVFSIIPLIIAHFTFLCIAAIPGKRKINELNDNDFLRL